MNKNFQILSQAIDYRSFSVPHVIYEFSLKPSDMGVMLALFKLQDDYVFKSKDYWGWFFVTNNDLARTARRTIPTIRDARQRLKYIGLIDYEVGNSFQSKATRYRIRIDSFYLADRALGRVKSRTTTKTISN